MTTKTIHYRTKPLMRAGKIEEARNGFRAINTDFTNNDEKNGYDVTYDNRIDVPIPKEQMTQNEFIQRLARENNVELI